MRAASRLVQLAAGRKAMPYYAAPCCAVPCRAVQCHAIPCCAVPCRVVPCYTVPCRAVQPMRLYRRIARPRSNDVTEGVDAFQLFRREFGNAPVPDRFLSRERNTVRYIRRSYCIITRENVLRKIEKISDAGYCYYFYKFYRAIMELYFIVYMKIRQKMK